MSKLEKKDLDNIEFQIYNKGRDIDVAAYNGIFTDLSNEYVLDSLMLYQNPDGGFGGGLAIDNYNPDSSVYATYEALRIIYCTGFSSINKEALYTSLTNKALNYLFNRCQIVKNKWNYTSIHNDKYAHSDFFTHKKENFEEKGYYPTVAIYALTLYLVNPNKAYYKKAMTGLKQALSEVLKQSTFSYYDILGFSYAIEICLKLNLFKDEVTKLNALFINEVKSMLSPKETWPNAKMPFVLCSHLKLDDELLALMEQNADVIIEQRASHGLWEPFHSWETSYPEEDSAMLKWIGYMTWNYLYLLKKFKKIALEDEMEYNN